ncbi:hypothetical protein [Sphaerisporangium sp. TRM90804]|uniref:hypothetical protein n=1 Tax=Sphaerisporangium sp. TRM90804 TaxID=3031113 RepID=UPI00244A8A38|nr:hypothetical protein [Sphaerisporangium sp. TRM90804]MDH2428295.1 hypothetical protein [Sphaerisporangium sp. TRM90804]
MTDPILCPECRGSRVQAFGSMFLACQFCGGLGKVGGEHESAETPPPPAAPPPAWEHRVWQDPAVAAAIPCRYCLGAGAVTRIDRQAGTLVSVPCRCSAL